VKNIPPQILQEFFKFIIEKDYSEQNCWGVVSLFYLKVLGVDLSQYKASNYRDRESNQSDIYFYAKDFEKVDTPKFGDIILFKIKGFDSHVGVYIDDKRFLHSTIKSNAVLDSLFYWQKQIVGFYRKK